MATTSADRDADRVKVTWWDRFLIGIAPTWGLRRVRARAAALAYEAAGGGRRSSGWTRSASDANAANTFALTPLRELSRDLRRNNGWVRRAVQTIKNNTVGWGIVPTPIGVGDGLKRESLALWNQWAESSRCDYDGRLTFSGLQSLVMETVVESGEALIVRQPANAGDGLPVPLRIQVLEPDYLDGSRHGMLGAGGGPIIQGIEFDKFGRRIAYWLYSFHPGSGLVAGKVFQSRRVDAKDVIHVYRMERPGQARGVPWAASAIARANDFDDFEDAELMKAKVAALFSAFVTDFEGGSTAIGEPDKKNPEFEFLEPGQVTYLPPGKQVTFAQPAATVEGSFTTRTLRRIAASFGVTYEDLTGDYSMVNFSSARMARLAHWQNVHDWRWNMLIPQFCAGAWDWFMELAAGMEGWNKIPAAKWTEPPMPMLEPEKEGLAYQRLVRNGTMTLYDMIREQGRDPVAHLAEIAEANKKLDDLGIVLDSDARRTNAAGVGQPDAAETADEPAAKPAPPAAAPAKPPAKPPASNGRSFPT